MDSLPPWCFEESSDESYSPRPRRRTRSSRRLVTKKRGAKESRSTAMLKKLRRRDRSIEPKNTLKDQLECTQCSKSFKTEKLLISHAESMHSSSYYCPICRKCNPGNKNDHMLNTHKKNDKYFCPVCDESFEVSKIGDFLPHVRKCQAVVTDSAEDDEEEVDLENLEPQVSEEVKEESNIRAKKYNKHDVLMCLGCKIVVKTSKIEHTKFHGNVNDGYDCPICCKHFPSFYAFALHTTKDCIMFKRLKIGKNEPEKTQTKKVRKLMKKRKVRRSERTRVQVKEPDDVWRCVVCRKLTKDKKQHIIENHSKTSSIISKKHQCQICLKKFEDLDEFVTHTTSTCAMFKAVEAKLLESNAARKPKATGVYRLQKMEQLQLGPAGFNIKLCSVCPMAVYDEKAHLNSYHFVVDNSNSDRIYQCPLCNESFGILDELWEHTKDSCGLFVKMFSFGYEKPKCEICDVDFYTVIELSEHMEGIHEFSMLDDDWKYLTDELKCSICFKVVDSKAELGEHVKYVHGDSVP